MVMEFFGFRKRQVASIYRSDLGHKLREVPTFRQPNADDTFISIPERDLIFLVDKYVQAVETGNSNTWCKCIWQIHPDDINLPKGQRRKRLVDPNPECPVHTKEGFLLYFFEWVFTQND